MCGQNPRLSPTAYCRSNQIKLIKETDALSRYKRQVIESEIINLTDSVYTWNGRIISLKHELHFTLIDYKTVKSLTYTFSQVWYECV